MGISKKVIHMVKHKSTGANVPIVITKVSANNEIKEYKEITKNRKYFTLDMLMNRWDKCRDEVIELLTQYHVPAHVSFSSAQDLFNRSLPGSSAPVDIALFFVEYIYALERKIKLPHNKLKPKKLLERDH